MIETSDRDGVRLISLNRAPSNVLNMELLASLRGALTRAEKDPSVRALVLASSCPKYFSSGIDLEELTGLPPERQSEPFLGLLSAYRELLSCPKPTVAALSGNAILGGWIVAMACDFRVLAEEARIALSEIRFGLSPTTLLIRRMQQISSSPVLVKEMVLRGKNLKSAEALAGGFVDSLAPASRVLEEALALAKSLAKQSPGGYASVKRSLNGTGSEESERLWKLSQTEFKELFADPQTSEGIMAMREKRRPKWEAV